MAHADELFAVIIPHVSDVKGGVCLALLTHLVDIARDRDAARRTDDDTVRVASSLLHERPEFLNLTSKVLQRNEDRHPAVGNTCGLCHTFGGQGSDKNRNTGSHWLEAQPKTTLQIENLARVLEGLPGQSHADNLDVLPQTRKRWLKGHAMPVLDDTIATGAKADNHASTGEFIEGSKVLGQCGWRAGIGIDNPRAEVNAPRFARQQRQYRKAVTPPGFCYPGGIDPGLIGQPYPGEGLIIVHRTLPVKTDRDFAGHHHLLVPLCYLCYAASRGAFSAAPPKHAKTGVQAETAREPGIPAVSTGIL